MPWRADSFVWSVLPLDDPLSTGTLQELENVFWESRVTLELSLLLKTEHCWVSKCKFLPKKKKKQKGFLIFGKSEFALEELEWRQGLRWGIQRPAADKALPSYTLSVNLWALLSEEAVVYVQCSCLCYCSRPGSSVWPSVVVFSMTAELDGLCSMPSQANESLSNGRSLWSLSGGASVWIMN